VLQRQSQLFLRTLREDPADAEVDSHKLLIRAGYIRRQAPGIFAWLPLGLRVRGRIEQVIREEMAAAGAQEVHFPALLPREPYETTGRWTEYGDGLFRLQDRKQADYLLAPTHEEAFTLLVKDLYGSYKDLPLTIYQIQDKYRDEARPRAGLLRGREFSMKDAYSFDVDDTGLDASYQAQRDAYERIFTRLGLDYVIVHAHAGAMGGSKSEEFLLPVEIGEDTFVLSEAGYAANVEAFRALAPETRTVDGLPAPDIHDTPDTPTIGALVALANERVGRPGGGEWSAHDTLKHVVLARIASDGHRSLVVVGLPGDRDIDLKRAEAAFSPDEIEPATEADFAAHPGLVKGYIGPWSPGGAVLGTDAATGIPYYLDPQVVDGSTWIAGANVEGKHVFHLVAGRDFTADGVKAIGEVREGDLAWDGTPVRLARGMEIGHVFQLGRKYAEALGLKVLDEHGKLVTVTMGSYGIGVTRILAAIAEITHDDKGLLWPAEIAPYPVHVVAAGKGDPLLVAESIASELDAEGIDVLFDDRDERPGVKFADAELLGMPYVVVAGKGVAEGVVELWDRRLGTRDRLPIGEAVGAVKRLLG